jgi:hypothetical protein
MHFGHLVSRWIVILGDVIEDYELIRVFHKHPIMPCTYFKERRNLAMGTIFIPSELDQSICVCTLHQNSQER